VTVAKGNGPRRRASSRGAEPRLDDKLIATIRRRLENDERVRRTLPAGGRVNVDRQLPFLIVYRPPPGRNDTGTRAFVRSEASYLIAPDDRRYRVRTRELARDLVSTLSKLFGGFLLIEVWAGPDQRVRGDDDGSPEPPAFRVVTTRRFAESPTVERLKESLGKIVLFKQPAEVTVVAGGRIGAHGMGTLVTAPELAELGAQVVGVEIRPVYRNPATGEEYPIAKRHLASQVSRALRRAAFEYARTETSARPRHYQSLGTRAFTKAAWEADAALAGISQEFDLLLYVSPTNADAAYAELKRSAFDRAPTFQYRPRDFDPGELKRRLHAINLERVEDPTMAHLFREKLGDLDLKLSLLLERDRERFLPLSVALYGRVDRALVTTAEQLLEQVRPAAAKGHRSVSAKLFVQRARQEFEGYRGAFPPFTSHVEVRDDLTSLMVSQGNLLVGRRMTFPRDRVEPLIQHEVGTHIVTHWNGHAQPFKLLSVGLAHYDELQEGLAVFAEYLAAGLTPVRMRTLAARVLAAESVVSGADFIDTWRLLHRDHDFGERMAFQIAMRVHRGGGFVKDSIYLRGVQKVLDYLADGGHLETLLVGKIATDHAPIIEELQRRRVLNPPPLRPAYLDDPDGQVRLDAARYGIELVDLVER
jgi:uncharacterized protein (TIGR02421 family)